MPKITFMGAGSTVFAKSVLGDSMLTPALRDAEIALYDIDAVRLRESKHMLDTLNANCNGGRARIAAHLGAGQRRAALRGADYVVNAIQVGGYEPSTVIDFEIPKRYGLRQTIADTLGIGGIFRALRTIPVMLDFARDMEAVCPGAWMLNYSNPMAMLTAAMLRGSAVPAVGLCHSVQGCARGLLRTVGIAREIPDLQWKIAGINHQAWLLEITDGGRDLYPEIKRRAAGILEAAAKGASPCHDLVRLHLMLQFGYYITESSEHNAEYVPYYIKSAYPELIERFRIPLDEYPRRCIAQIEGWKRQGRDLVANPRLTHQRSHEYASSIMEAMETDVPFRIGGNVMNRGLIANLPAKACVEVACLVDRNGVQGCAVGDLPEACAALNRTNINVQILTVEAALTRRRDAIYQAAMLDPHTAAELPIDRIRAMCDDLIAAHGRMLPKYRATAIRPIPPAPSAANLGPWSVLGPLDNRGPGGKPLGLAGVFPPERGFSPRTRLAGVEGRRIGWRRVEAGEVRPNGLVDLRRLLGAAENAVAYARTVFTVPRAGRARLLIGSDDGIAVWLNGREVFRLEAAREARPAQNAVALPLRRGPNELLLKVDQKIGGWGFFAQWARKPRGLRARPA